MKESVKKRVYRTVFKCGVPQGCAHGIISVSWVVLASRSTGLRAAETLIQPLGITRITVYRAAGSLTWNYPLLPPPTPRRPSLLEEPGWLRWREPAQMGGGRRRRGR